MRRVYAFDMITVDGIFEGPNHDLSWHNVDEEFNEFAIKQLRETGTLLFGRITYRMMADYWPTSAAINDDPVVAGLMNSVEKVVFSTTLERAGWNNTRLVRDDPAVEVSRMKAETGKEVGILGSSQLLSSLMPGGLIDEFRLMINPVILGTGSSLFAGSRRKTTLQLIESRPFASGNVLLRYRS